MADEANTTTPQQPAVDETPISPVRPDGARKNSLENLIKHRPNRDELVQSLSTPLFPSCRHRSRTQLTARLVLCREYPTRLERCAGDTGPAEGGKNPQP